MTHAANHRLVAAAAAALSAALLASFLAWGAVRDRSADRNARASLAQAEARRDAGDIDAAAAQVRAAAAEAAPLLDGWWAAHAWARTLRAGELADLRARLDDAVAALARSVDARTARIDGLRSLRSEVDYAATLADLDAIESRRAAFGPLLAVDAPEAHRELVRALGTRRADFAADADANTHAIRATQARFETAGNDPRALLAVVDAVLPRPARADEAQRLASLKARASAARSAMLAGDRLREAEGLAALAPSAREARRALSAIDADPDLARPADEALAGRITAARAAIGRRIDALSAWESSVAALELGLAAGEPGAAARALARLEPCDERTRAVAERLRDSFGARVLESFTAGAIAAADRGDLTALERRADAVRPGSDAWKALGAAEREKAAASIAAIDARVDRALYDEFLRSPSAELAARYLEGWPARVRRMAPWVLEWRARAEGAPVRIALEGARWRSLGVESAARTLEDRPDADISLRGPNGTGATERAEDIRSDSVAPLRGASLTVGPHGAPLLRVEAVVAIDLRDAVAADPVARGFEERAMAAWRAGRVVELPVRDPLWGERPHLLLLRVTSPGLTALPPFPRR